MWKHGILLVAWLVLTPLTLLFSLQTFQGQAKLAHRIGGLAQKQNPYPQVLGTAEDVIAQQTPELLYAAIPWPSSKIKTAVESADARSEILRQYLRKYQSPLEPLANLLVQEADENGFDFRWMVAIAQQESNLCKKIPENSYNCWGWGIYGDKVTRFASFKDAIEKIAPQFKQKFLHTGPDTDPSQVMKTYTPPSDGSWAFGVNQFMEEME